MKVTKYLGKIVNWSLYGYIALTLPKKCAVPIQHYQDRVIYQAEKKITPKKILVIDEFCKNSVKIDMDNIGDISHGFITSRIIEDGLPNANVYKKNIKNPFFENNNYIKDSIAEPILKEMKAGKKYDAVNLSIGFDADFDDLSKMVGEEITPENIASKKRKVKDFLLNNHEKVVDKRLLFFGLKSKEVIPMIDCMDSLSAKGTKVYVSAGNSFENTLNLLSLIDNSVSVGALDEYGEKELFSGNNSLVKRWIKGFIPVKKTDYGYQIIFDKSKKDIEEHNSTGFWHLTDGSLRGTSYSAPRALVEDMK